MIVRIFKYGSVALGALLMLPGTSSTATAQGPVRNTARGVVQGTAQATRGVAQGAAQATRRAGEATGNIVRGAADATGNAVRRTGEAAGNVVRGATPPYSGNYSSGYRGTVQPNGAYVEGQPGAYQTQPAYGQGQVVNQGYANSGQVYLLRHDAYGREFICENGHRVYFTNQSNQMNSNDQMNSNQPETATADQQTPQEQTSNKPVMDEPQNGTQNSDAAQPAEQQNSSDLQENNNLQDQRTDLQQDANQADANLNSETQIQSGDQGASGSIESNLNSNVPETPQPATSATDNAG